MDVKYTVHILNRHILRDTQREKWKLHKFGSKLGHGKYALDARHVGEEDIETRQIRDNVPCGDGTPSCCSVHLLIHGVIKRVLSCLVIGKPP